MLPRNEPEPIAIQLWRRRRWIAPGVVVALIAALSTSYSIHLAPPSLEKDSAEFAASSTQVLVDFPETSSILEVARPLSLLVERANVYARLAASPVIIEIVADHAGVDPKEIDARGPFNPNQPRAEREPTAERRATQLFSERSDYRLRFDSEKDQDVPIVNVYAQAPTELEATRLASAGAVGLTTYVDRLQREEAVADKDRVQIRQLGKPIGAVVNPGVDRQIAVLTFLGALVAWSMVVLLGGALIRFLRGHAQPQHGGDALADVVVEEPADLRSAARR